MGIEKTIEYFIVHEYYRFIVAERSKVYKIFHIKEGCHILEKLGASMAAKRAFCIHPMCQDDKDLAENYQYLFNECDAHAVALALEYRNIANQYLSHRDINSVKEIVLSPIPDINLMLIADKIQNRKDFELYLKGKIKNSDRMVQYFANWHTRLGITEEVYQGYVTELQELFPDNRAENYKN